MIYKKLLLILIFISSVVAFDKININKKTVANANVVLLTVTKKDISNIKLTFKKLNLNFLKNKFKENQYYALVPISYYESFKNKKIIISFIKNKKRHFKGITFKVIEGDYKKETLKVAKGKIELSKENKKRTNIEYKEAMKIYTNISKDILWTKDFIEPIKSVTTSPFGTKRVFNNQLKSYHSGLDYKAKTGEKIFAINEGIVKLVKNRFYAGGSVVIDHGHGVFSSYFHLSKFKVKVGEKVSQGQLIGLSGSSGRVTGPHLHFAIKIHGVTVDPIKTISILNNLN